jgi:hypothetical protein
MPETNESLEAVYMPDGRGGIVRAPFVLSAQEAVAFLRIESGTPTDTLAYYRKRGKLRGKQVGHGMVYLLEDLVRFVRDGADTSGD